MSVTQVTRGETGDGAEETLSGEWWKLSRIRHQFTDSVTQKAPAGQAQRDYT